MTSSPCGPQSVAGSPSITGSPCGPLPVTGSQSRGPILILQAQRPPQNGRSWAHGLCLRYISDIICRQFFTNYVRAILCTQFKFYISV